MQTQYIKLQFIQTFYFDSVVVEMKKLDSSVIFFETDSCKNSSSTFSIANETLSVLKIIEIT